MQQMEKIRELLGRNRLDGILISKRNNFAWVTDGKENYVNNGVDEGVAWLYVTPYDQYVVANNIELPRIMKEEVADLGCVPSGYNWYEPFGKSEFARMIKDKRIGTDSQIIAGAEMVMISDQLSEARSVMDNGQLLKYRELAVDTTEAIEAVCRLVEPGWTEQEIRGEVAREALRRSINPMIICVMSDARIYQYRHPIATDKRVESYVLISVCFEKYGLVSSSTRAVHFGPLDAQLRNKMEKLARVDAAMIANTLESVSYRSFFELIMRLYDEAGYPNEWKLHYQGGPAGYAPREYHITPATGGTIKVNQVYGWNPTITGTKSEDMTLLTEIGPEVISMTGCWPTIDVEVKGKIWKRPAILER